MTKKRAKKLLLVEDNPGDARLLREMLNKPDSHGTQLPYEYTETASVEEAIAACEKCDFDCAIVDYRLPGMDGLAGISLLHKRLPYMAIIITTGQGDEMIASEAIKRGASDYIPKTHISADSIRRISDNAIERMTLRRQLAQRREELENFANMLVHDLKAPTRAIQRFAAYVESSISEGNPEQIAEDCRRISKAARRMDALVDTLHQYTRAESQVVFEPVDTNQVMKDTLSNLESVIQEHGASVTHGALPVVTGNAVQLSQLLQNLIGNGIKYCEAEIPTVRIAATRHEAGTWLFSVGDNGIGVPEEYYEQVFQPFKRLHGVDKYEGTGLGLSTCTKIVERHAGTIWCESNDGPGTTFFFTLPGVQ